MEIYSGAFSTIELRPGNSLLLVCWNEASKNLEEEGVKLEIGRVLEYVREHSIENVIVDARNYVFRDNAGIQSWINHTYMPAIMDTGVKKYALIVEARVEDSYADFEDQDTVLPVVEYFTEVKEAIEWIES